MYACEGVVRWGEGGGREGSAGIYRAEEEKKLDLVVNVMNVVIYYISKIGNEIVLLLSY